jgi:radical SAM superfamily enzyme YgiQ (UPF0313 family)
MKERYIDPIAELGGRLLEVEKPARYVGGEFGILAKNAACFRSLIAFPDLYEIGMSNQALRIIYNSLNSMPGIFCDRAFAPAPDFEKLLREKNIPLYGLDTGIALADLDLLMFTIGYELGLSGVIAMLDIAQIPLHCSERGRRHPIVIAGGPAISNPLPFSPFIDAFWIGEAEAGFFELVAELVRLKESGKGRGELQEKISCHPNVWVQAKKKAKRAVAVNFSEETAAAVYPVPSMKVVHHHGMVEIMRGCPNGCRFCHAGFWYRPMRQKRHELIINHVQAMVEQGGWQEISLSSLSSGDYTGVGELIDALNKRFSSRHISFQMPSLKVSGFSYTLLEKISATRKSGITFAVETPEDLCQMAINKEVSRDQVVVILEELKKRGWRTAKFYFMIGLPVRMGGDEEAEIVSFITDIGRRTRMLFTVNVGIFVPKPHTPYQWSAQLDTNTAAEKLAYIKSRLKRLGHKVSVSDILISRIEGLLSRGDEKAGLLCEQAYLGGSRLDAWNEYINKDKWLELLEKNRDITGIFSIEKRERLPWQGIDSNVNKNYLLQELENSDNSQQTGICRKGCVNPCGVCNKKIKIAKNALMCGISADKNETKTGNVVSCDPANNASNIQAAIIKPQGKSDPLICRVLFSFSKQRSAVFHGHLSIIELFSMAFIRSGLPVLYTQGFNPLAKIEFASPLTTGISASAEIAAADFTEGQEIDIFIIKLNSSLPEGIRIEKAEVFYILPGMKKHSLSSLLWGFGYTANHGTDYVKAVFEKTYRQKQLMQNTRAGLFYLNRNAVLSRNIIDDSNEWASYFDVYQFLYPVNKSKTLE